MGKKSRLKRKRRAQISELLQRLDVSRQQMNKNTEESYQQSGEALGEFFAQYGAADVVLALSISDLWLPNISSQVKHHFALGAAVSMAPNQFTGAKHLDT